MTSFLSPQLKSGTLFPYNPIKAKELLASHGWRVTLNLNPESWYLVK